MGLHKHYLRYGQSAREKIFGIARDTRSSRGGGGGTGVGGGGGVGGKHAGAGTPLSMLISQGTKFNSNRVAVIMLGIITLIAGVLLSSLPWLDYFILKNLKLWNNTLSFHYWQKPGVIRLTKLYIFNVTNPDGFLLGEKPKLVEVGPFVYREEMEKVNVMFHDNYTVTYQHKKILQFVPEMSLDKNLRIITPNIPLLTLSSQTNNLGFFLSRSISLMLTVASYKPFVSLTVDELVFGYDDTLVNLAHKFYPREKRPMSKMGLLIGRNGTLSEIATINSGMNGMDKFGYLDRLNGLDHLPFWKDKPCSNIFASEGSFFPPRAFTNSNVVYVYDKDLCRVLPLEYVRPMEKDGIAVDLYEMPENVFGDGATNPDNACYDNQYYKAIKGLQNISPCQYGAPVYISNPHFYQSDPALLEEVEGLKPNKTIHDTFFKIQPFLGVPLEGKVRVQLNLKVDRAPHIEAVKNFRDIVFPIMWVEEGVAELPPNIRRWIYLATVFAPNAVPVMSYGMIVSSAFMFIFVFVRSYKNFVFQTDPTIEILEMGRRSLRRGSSFLSQSQHRILAHRDSYILLKADNNNEGDSPS